MIILGTVATVFITALLLNQQTAIEIEKEPSIKFLDLKSKTYEKLTRAFRGYGKYPKFYRYRDN